MFPKKEFLLFGAGALVGVLGLLIFLPQKKCDSVVFTQADVCEKSTEPSLDVVVDVSGAVANPGVYKFPQGSRISDAIKSAGDVLADKVDKAALSKNINLAQIVQDGAKIYIPFEGDSSKVYYSKDVASEEGSVLNINTASEGDLDSKLAGIGPVFAQKIVAGRPYSRIEELYERNIISKSVFEKIKEYVSVN